MLSVRIIGGLWYTFLDTDLIVHGMYTSHVRAFIKLDRLATSAYKLWEEVMVVRRKSGLVYCIHG